MVRWVPDRWDAWEEVSAVVVVFSFLGMVFLLAWY